MRSDGADRAGDRRDQRRRVEVVLGRLQVLLRLRAGRPWPTPPRTCSPSWTSSSWTTSRTTLAGLRRRRRCRRRASGWSAGSPRSAGWCSPRAPRPGRSRTSCSSAVGRVVGLDGAVELRGRRRSVRGTALASRPGRLAAVVLGGLCGAWPSARPSVSVAVGVVVVEADVGRGRGVGRGGRRVGGRRRGRRRLRSGQDRAEDRLALLGLVEHGEIDARGRLGQHGRVDRDRRAAGTARPPEPPGTDCPSR